MLKKEEKRHTETLRAHGITVGKNGLNRILIHGVALLCLPALAILVWLLLFRQPALESDLTEKISQGYASQRAAVITARIEDLKGSLAGVLNDHLVREALETGDLDVITRAERSRLALFPGALGLRLFALSDMGSADLTGDRQGLRNHIEVDMVRRATNGESAPPEVYRQNDRWLVSLAVRGSNINNGGSSAVALVTFDYPWLASAVATPQITTGQFTLSQRLIGREGRRDTYIAGATETEAARSESAVTGTSWIVSFTPEKDLIESIEDSVAQSTLGMVLTLLCGIGAFGLVAARYTALIKREIQRVEAASEHRTPYTLNIPELAPIARTLRKLTLRRARLEGAGGVPRVLPAARVSSSTAPALATVEGPAQDLPLDIFRAYDIRGVADTDLTDDTVYRIGAALGTVAGNRGEQTLILGYDGRESSGRIKAGLERALVQSGRDVIDIGLVPTPLMYFATHRYDAHSGVMVTGSHGPAEYNGLKIVLDRQPIADGDMEKLRNIALSGKFSQGTGHMLQRDVTSDYLDEVVSDIAIAMPLRIVIDAGNGATGHIAPTLFEELGCEVIPLYCDIDGRFPNRSPDTSIAANLRGLIEAVRKEDADFGIALDGDGDRVAAVTADGSIVPADYLLMLFARDVITRNPGADIVYDIKCSRNLAQLITSLGGRGVQWKSGHSKIKEKVAETNALLGGEFSGHMVFGERWYGFDDGMYAAARLAEIVASGEKTLGQLLNDLPQSVSTPEILLPVEERQKFAIIEAFHREAKFEDGRINNLDGVRVDFPKGWGLLRASNTSAALTARFEADDEASLQSIMNRFRAHLSDIQPDLDINF